MCLCLICGGQHSRMFNRLSHTSSFLHKFKVSVVVIALMFAHCVVWNHSSTWISTLAALSFWLPLQRSSILHLYWCLALSSRSLYKFHLGFSIAPVRFVVRKTRDVDRNWHQTDAQRLTEHEKLWKHVIRTAAITELGSQVLPGGVAKGLRRWRSSPSQTCSAVLAAETLSLVLHDCRWRQSAVVSESLRATLQWFFSSLHALTCIKQRETFLLGYPFKRNSVFVFSDFQEKTNQKKAGSESRLLRN